jgi:hypothetical protein
MATTNPFAYNTGSTIGGTTQVGSLAVGTTNQNYSGNIGGVPWWMGPDEELGYVIAHPVPSNTQPTQIPGTFASLGFDRTKDFLDSSFINLAEYVTRKYSTPQTFSSATDASIWLTNNGFWNSYITPLLYLDAGNPLSYSGTGTIWTDLVGGKQFTLYNSPTYSSSNGGYLSFDSGLQQYGETTTSLPNLSTWSVGVWHYYTGTNIGDGMCIVTEVYPGTTGHINYSLGDNQGSGFSSGFFDISAWRTSGVYTLTPNNWYYIVGTYDGTTNKLYVNNSLVASDNFTGTPLSSDGGIRLMRRWDLPDYWGGYLSTVGIYNKALDSTQISSIWNSTKSRYGL